ncbi:MAG: hypothetical protein AAFO04_26425, partial [Cyanobacteria bacterium J06592_8]
ATRKLQMGARYAGDVLMTTAVFLRSGMTRNCHVPFWRAAALVRESLTLMIELWGASVNAPRGSELLSCAAVLGLPKADTERRSRQCG